MGAPIFSTPSFINISISDIVVTPVLMGILVVFSIGYAIATAVLIYHWSAYGMRSPGILVAESLFLFISLVLFVFSGLAISYF